MSKPKKADAWKLATERARRLRDKIEQLHPDSRALVRAAHEEITVLMSRSEQFGYIALHLAFHEACARELLRASTGEPSANVIELDNPAQEDGNPQDS